MITSLIARARGLDKEEMIWFWNNYLGSESDRTNPYASPLRSKDLSGLPPALIITAEYDALRDEAEAYAQRLEEAGVEVICQRYSGMVHGFMAMSNEVEAGRDAVQMVASWMAHHFETK